MGFKIGRETPAPDLEIKKSARFGEQFVVATETPVVPDEPVVLDEDEETIEVAETPAEETQEEQKVEDAEVSEPKKARRGRKPKKISE